LTNSNPALEGSSEVLTPNEHTLLQQSMNQDEQRALQEGALDATKAVQPSIIPRYPSWPTSKPGPQSTPPPQGERPINALRSEQMMVINYSQQTDTSGAVYTLPDPNRQGPGLLQNEQAPEAHKPHKQRL
jgi:hypothetical protein